MEEEAPKNIPVNIDQSGVSQGGKLEEQDRYKEAVPVESIIPGIKEATSTVKEQQKERMSKEDEGFEDDFWENHIHTIINPDVAQRENIPDLMEIPDIIKGRVSREKEALELFKDQIIVDLGAGTSNSGYLLAEFLKAKAYIGVELYHYEYLSICIERISNKVILELHNWGKESENDRKWDYHYFLPKIPNWDKHHIPYSVVPGDMLSFLKRLPDDSVSIMMGGIDFNIIRDQEYRKEVYKEIERVLSKDGGFLSTLSEHPPEDFNLGIAFEGPNPSGDYIFRKKK